PRATPAPTGRSPCRRDSRSCRRTSGPAGWPPCCAGREASQVTAGLMIEGLPLWFTETNAWVVAPSGPGGECVLIDAPPVLGTILERLAHHELRLAALINTHGHVDHVGGVGEVVRAQDHDVPVHIHDDDRHMLIDPV